jgi:hypothetical protein
MEQGKPAGARCIQLSEDNRCKIFGSDIRPAVCSSLQPSMDMCGESDEEAMLKLSGWEQITCPDSAEGKD